MVGTGVMHGSTCQGCSICLVPPSSHCMLLRFGYSLQEETAGARIQLPCKHTFCGPCILSWAQQHDACPNCRKNFIAAAEPQTTEPQTTEPQATEPLTEGLPALEMADERLEIAASLEMESLQVVGAEDTPALVDDDLGLFGWLESAEEGANGS